MREGKPCWASTTATRVDVAAKSLWITQLFSYATDLATGARMIVWFNEDKETDWAVFGGRTATRRTTAVERATRRTSRIATLCRPKGCYLPPITDEQRIITDAMFSGGW